MKNNARSVCPIACTLDVVGDKWTLLIIRDLILGRGYFKEFMASPEGIASNILTQRINRLVTSGIIEAIPDKATVGRNRYDLTKKGQAMAPIIKAMADWGLNNIEGTSIRLHPKSS
jgi:DNA-binding HxlR family transcriptional regulator